MKKWNIPIVLLMASFCSAQSLTRLKIEPLDFSNENAANYPHGVHQMECDGEEIYIRSRKDGMIFVIDPSGRILRTIGRRGEGPGEFRGGIHAMEVHQGHLFAVAWGHRDRISHFFRGAFQGDISLHSRNVSFQGIGTNHFAVLGDLVVFPSHPASGALAVAYGSDGRQTPFGKLVFDREDSVDLEQNPGLNDTLWVSDGTKLFAVFRYLPLLHEYDANLQLVKSFQLENERLVQLEEKVRGYDRASFSTPPPLFRDIKYVGGDLYLLAPATLFRIDAETGEIRSVYTFYGTGEDFIDTSELNFQTFVLLGDGHLILGPGWLWNHDLWTADLPDIDGESRLGSL